MTPTVVLYVVYTIICTGIAAWVGRTLQRSGPAFVSHGKQLDEEVVESITHLLVVGFYLIAFGAICFLLNTSSQVSSAEDAMEVLSVKIGFVLVVTGIVHFYLVATLVRIRNNAGSVVAATVSEPTAVGKIVADRNETAE